MLTTSRIPATIETSGQDNDNDSKVVQDTNKAIDIADTTEYSTSNTNERRNIMETSFVKQTGPLPEWPRIMISKDEDVLIMPVVRQLA